ncbi:MAG TPA: phospholipase D-like domain-containing protein [Gemmatimonadales bacterium]|nr:phospholipase D-like domain-containing protein [Gemmatimonadales bacterium]
MGSVIHWAELLVGPLHVILALAVSGHIVLTKDDVRGAIGWVGLVWLTPIVGSLLYASFGVNRIRRQAGRRRGTRRPVPVPPGTIALASETAPPVDTRWSGLARLVGATSRLPLTPANAVEPLSNGDVAYPAMLQAIENAERSVALASYIFERGQAGDRFVGALAEAAARGVEVRVLIDGVGARYGRAVRPMLRRRGVPTSLFLPPLMPLSHPYFNLRNHRKILVVDGRVGFCGGLNIRDACLLKLNRHDATQDVHFRMTGPVVGQLLACFAEDWRFAAHERLEGAAWEVCTDGEPGGDVLARGVPDGPDENFQVLVLTLLGAIAQARERIRIVTPYFLPDQPLVDALKVAALRGVEVELVLPEHGNLQMVEWAAWAQLPQVMRWGCRVILSQPPFDHSKIMTVDGGWALVGSANWDPRSLRLNFEYCVEGYSADLTRRLDALIDEKVSRGRELPLGELLGRGLLRRLRDGAMWLAQPYL